MMNRQLAITLPNGTRKTVPLTGERLCLGRSIDNDLSYPEDSGLSRHHMVFENLDGIWHARDLGSKNGTLVNDERISGAVPLKDGDRIAASRVSMVLGDAEQDIGSGTVIFEPVKTADKPPTHTVTLGELLPLVAADTDKGPAIPERHWTDPVTVLVRAGRKLVGRKSGLNLFEEILDLCMEAVGAGRGVLMMKEDDQLRVLASRGEEFHISTAVRDRVLRQRSSLLISDAMLDEALRMRQSIVRQKVHSLMAAPLQTDEDVLGLIYVDTPGMWREFTRDDLNLLTIMANVAALRIERERLAVAEESRRLLENELQRAAEIQRQILPGSPPVVDKLDLAGYNSPCHTVGGDYYDFLKGSDGRVMLALGDVAGKGLSAALLMVSLQARVQMLAEHRSGPAEMVSNLNRAMKAACPGNRFVTFFLCQIDPDTGDLAYCNAGHNPPVIVGPNGEARELEGGGPVLGILPSVIYEQKVLRLKAGDVLVVYSDGVTEATNSDGEEFGEQRLIGAVVDNRGQDADEILEEVIRVLDDFVGGAPAADDITLVVAKRTP